MCASFNHPDLSNFVGKVSPCGELYGSVGYWTKLWEEYSTNRPRLLEIVPEGHWIVYKFGWLDQPLVTLEKEDIKNVDFSIIVRPGHETEDLAPSSPAYAFASR